MYAHCSGGDLAPSLGDGNIFRGPRFLNDVFSGKISIFTPKIHDDLFLVIDQVFKILRFITVLNVVHDPFFTRKTTISENNSLIRPFFTLFVLPRASDNTTFLNIGGTNAWAVPHLKFFFEDRPPSHLRSSPLTYSRYRGTLDTIEKKL